LHHSPRSLLAGCTFTALACALDARPCLASTTSKAAVKKLPRNSAGNLLLYGSLLGTSHRFGACISHAAQVSPSHRGRYAHAPNLGDQIGAALVHLKFLLWVMSSLAEVPKVRTFLPFSRVRIRSPSTVAVTN
jgi:hypothetical protein